MRIAIDASILELPCPTGVERVARETIAALPQVLRPRDELIVLGCGSVPPLPEAGRRVRGVALGGRQPLALWRESRLVAALQSQAAHVLWSPVVAVPLRTDVPRVVTVHELPWLVRAGLEGRLRERVHRTRLRLAVDVAARLVVPSRTVAGQLADEAPEAAERVRVVPHALPTGFVEPADAEQAAAVRAIRGVPDGDFLLHVGGGRARKNVGLLVRAYARYLLQGGRRPLVLVGPGSIDVPLPGSAMHLGYVSDEVLRALYAGAAALVVSSASEGFGLPLLEAMAVGVPVVSTDAGALTEVAQGAAWVVPSDDDEALAAALLGLESHGTDLDTRVEAGRRVARQRTWEDAARELRSVLAEAAGRS